VSIVAVIVVAVIAVLLLAMLVAGARKSAAVRHAGFAPPADDPPSFRSHAEASRGDEEKT
jgi:hypothetical protein